MALVIGGVSPIQLPEPIRVGRGRGPAGTGRPEREISPGEEFYVKQVQKQLEELQRNMELVISKIKEATPAAIVYGMQPIYDLSQDLVPVDTGDLKRSGFLEGVETASGGSARIGYGKDGFPTYAALVHERTDTRHAKGKQAKFLEEAVNQKFGDFRRRVILYMRRLTAAEG